MSSKSETHQKIQSRRAIVSSAFTMIMLLAVVGLFSLFSIWSINRAWTTGAAEAAALQSLSGASLDAQVAFKVQVQEWKNILLRGEDAGLLEKHLASFRKHGEATARHLERVAMEARTLGFSDSAAYAASLNTEHTSLTAQYETALADARAGAPALPLQMAMMIDRELRGIDRDLESGISRMASDMAALSEGNRNTLTTRMEERYRTLKWFVIGVIALSLAITAYAVSGALRATRS